MLLKSQRNNVKKSSVFIFYFWRFRTQKWSNNRRRYKTFQPCYLFFLFKIEDLLSTIGLCKTEASYNLLLQHHNYFSLILSVHFVVLLSFRKVDVKIQTANIVFLSDFFPLECQFAFFPQLNAHTSFA